MERGKYIIQFLDKNHVDGVTHTVKREYRGREFQLAIAERDKFTYVFDSIRIENVENESKLDFDELQRRAKIFCKKTNYLTEKLDIIEMDSTAGTVLIRSKLTYNEPSTEKINYFELKLNCNRVVTVMRFSHDKPAKVTQSQTFHMTTDIVEKFINHLLETID